MKPGENRAQELPIAVFDSGLGGISVLRELTKLMPDEDFWYFGDSANAPYGTRPREEIRRLTLDKVEYFMDAGIKALAVACNTATSAAVRVIREMYPGFPVVGIEPAIKPAALENPGGRVLVMATPMTLQMEKFHRLLHAYENTAEIIPIPCPGLMELIERGCLAGPELGGYLAGVFDGYLDLRVDGIVLGCTHYPFARAEIEKLFGPEVKLYDGAQGVARELARRIREAGVMKQDGGPGKIRFENSLNTEEEIRLCWELYRANI